VASDGSVGGTQAPGNPAAAALMQLLSTVGEKARCSRRGCHVMLTGAGARAAATGARRCRAAAGSARTAQAHRRRGLAGQTSRSPVSLTVCAWQVGAPSRGAMLSALRSHPAMSRLAGVPRRIIAAAALLRRYTLSDLVHIPISDSSMGPS
jgi:hypothetical protein